MSFPGRHTRTRPARRPRLEVEAVESRALLSTLFVNPTGLHKNQPAFTTIQGAVNAARPGDTIDVDPATYHENVTINKSQLSLLGAQAGVDPITGLRTDPSKESTVEGGITITSNASVQVDGFTLNDPGGNPLADQGGVGDLLTNNIILPGARVAGIEVFGSPLTTVSDNEIEGAGLFGISVDGITVVGSPPTQLADAVRNNRVVNSSLEGINVFNAVDVVVDSNAVSGSASFGLNVQQSSGVRATKNLLTANAGGAVFFNSSTNLIQGNTVEFNRIDGLDDEGDQGDTILANSLIGNATSGLGNALFLSNAAGGEKVQNNLVLNNHSNGIEVFGASIGLIISGNTVENNGGVGIGLNGTIGVIVVGNTVENNGGDGIGLDGTTSSTVTGNTVNDNATGIHLVGSSKNQITQNVAGNNKVDGIHLDGTSTGNTVSNNTALGNGVFDAEDNSLGKETGHTANLWTHNTEKKDNDGGALGH